MGLKCKLLRYCPKFSYLLFQGGSEVWTAENQTVIASLAFHPSDRVLVIATFNEVYFWDWSRPEPFAHVATSNAKEKVSK